MLSRMCPVLERAPNLTAEIDELWELEISLCAGDADLCGRHLTADALVLFTEPISPIGRKAIIQTIGEIARGQEAKRADSYALRLHPAVVPLTSKTAAHRGYEEAGYRTHFQRVSP